MPNSTPRREPAQTELPLQLVQRFAALFPGGSHHTVYDPRKLVIEDGKSVPEYGWRHRPVTIADWHRHFSGVRGLSIPPNLDNGNARWACIDLDTYDMDIAEWAGRIESLGLPVIPVRSKSGGAHGFSFFDDAIPVPDAIALMSAVVRRLGLPDTTEIFPLDRARAQGMNVPYLGYFSEVFERQVGVVGRKGGEMGLSAFVRLAEKLRMTADHRAALLHNAPRPSPRGRPRGGKGVQVSRQVVPPEIIEMMIESAGRGLSSNPEDVLVPEDTELKIQFALDAIPPQSYHEWMRIGGMIACALRDRTDDDGRGLWEEWSGPRDDKTNKCDDFKWSECMKFTAFERDGSSIFWLADKYDPGRLWRRAYATALNDTNRGTGDGSEE